MRPVRAPARPESYCLVLVALDRVVRQPAHELAPLTVRRPDLRRSFVRTGFAQAVELSLLRHFSRVDQVKLGAPVHGCAPTLRARFSACLARNSEIWRSASSLLSE